MQLQFVVAFLVGTHILYVRCRRCLSFVSIFIHVIHFCFSRLFSSRKIGCCCNSHRREDSDASNEDYRNRMLHFRWCLIRLSSACNTNTMTVSFLCDSGCSTICLVTNRKLHWRWFRKIYLVIDIKKQPVEMVNSNVQRALCTKCSKVIV